MMMINKYFRLVQVYKFHWIYVFICAFIDYIVMFVVMWSPAWDETFIMYDVLEGTGREMMIAPCKVLYMYMCVEW
jgi:hypothetical protein